MELIDSHVHLYPEELNRAPAAWAAAHGENHWATLCTRTRKDGRAVQGFPSVDDLLRAMDAAGVGRAILQGWYWEKRETCAWQNRFYAECVRAHPDRLSACAALHPGQTSEAQMARLARVRAEVRAAADAGFCGLGELSPHSQGVAADDAVWYEILALAGELGLAVNCHVTELAGAAGRRTYPGKIATPLGDFVHWAQAHPRTRFVLAHWGARLPLDAEWGAAARAAENLFYDTAASPLIYGAGADLDKSGALWREMVDAVGAGKIVFGSDFPLVLYPKTEAAPSLLSFAEEARASGLTPREWALVARANALRIYSCGNGVAGGGARY